MWLVSPELLWFLLFVSVFSAAVCQFTLNTSAARSSAVWSSWQADSSKSAQCLRWDAQAASSANESTRLLTDLQTDGAPASTRSKVDGSWLWHVLTFCFISWEVFILLLGGNNIMWLFPSRWQAILYKINYNTWY